MIVKINGAELEERSFFSTEQSILEKYSKPDPNRFKKICMGMWSMTGTFLVNTQAFAASPEGQNLWLEMKPIFGLFQEIGMVIGSFAIISGLIIMIFKKRLATNIITTAVIAVAGIFLVPSTIMLLAIIGTMMNDALTTVFSNLNIGGSVQVK